VPLNRVPLAAIIVLADTMSRTTEVTSPAVHAATVTVGPLGTSDIAAAPAPRQSTAAYKGIGFGRFWELKERAISCSPLLFRGNLRVSTYVLFAGGDLMIGVSCVDPKCFGVRAATDTSANYGSGRCSALEERPP